MLQAVAWARMLVDYTEERGLVVGVTETFDGSRACPMCKKIAAGRQEEQKKKAPLTPQSQESAAKWIGSSVESIVPRPSWSEANLCVCMTSPEMRASQWDAQPPVPPPEWVA